MCVCGGLRVRKEEELERNQAVQRLYEPYPRTVTLERENEEKKEKRGGQCAYFSNT